MPAPKPRVVVTRRLPEPVETRMRELFEDVRWEWPAEFGRIPHPMGLHEEAATLVRRAEKV